MSGLAGKRILVTRPAAQAEAFCAELAARGAVPIRLPTIQVAPLEDFTALDRALLQLDRYAWVVFTSVNGVAAVFDRLALLGRNGSALQPARVAAIGPATAQALQRRGVNVAFVPDEFVAEAIVDGLGEVHGQWVLLPRAELAREALAEELGRRGAVVHEVAAYRTLPARPDPEGLAELRLGVDALTFTSSSTVRNFAALLAADPDWPRFSQAAIACIGPITAATARELGLRVDVQAAEYTTGGLAAALEAYFSAKEFAV